MKLEGEAKRQKIQQVQEQAYVHEAIRVGTLLRQSAAQEARVRATKQQVQERMAAKAAARQEKLRLINEKRDAKLARQAEERAAKRAVMEEHMRRSEQVAAALEEKQRQLTQAKTIKMEEKAQRAARIRGEHKYVIEKGAEAMTEWRERVELIAVSRL